MQSPNPKDQGYQALLESYLRTLNLPTFLEQYQAYAKDAARLGLSCERFLLALWEAEISHRDPKRIERAIAFAKLPLIKELTSYAFTALEASSQIRILGLPQVSDLQTPE